MTEMSGIPEKLYEAERRRRARCAELRLARKKGDAPPPRTPHSRVFPNTEAHRILTKLYTQGPTTSRDLGGGAFYGHTYAQILRLCEMGLIERDSGSTYDVTEKCLAALDRLDSGLSHTEWHEA